MVGGGTRGQQAGPPRLISSRASATAGNTASRLAKDDQGFFNHQVPAQPVQVRRTVDTRWGRASYLRSLAGDIPLALVAVVEEMYVLPLSALPRPPQATGLPT